MIAIVDYGMGNIHSVSKALISLGGKVFVSSKDSEIKKADKLVLPGVGAFGDAMSELKKRRLDQVLVEHIKDKKLFLGICLGMHLIFESSQESDSISGLGILKGSVKKFASLEGFKVPHMGWNQIKIEKNNCPFLKNLKDSSSVYFCHSYYPVCEDNAVVAASTDYGVKFPSIIWQDNILATQFHPEKSQQVGLKMLENFLAM